MTPFEEIMSTLGMYSRAEKTELTYRLITEKLCDPELIIDELGLTDELNNRKRIAEEEVEEENSLDTLLWDVPTEKIAEYVNDFIKEMQ